MLVLSRGEGETIHVGDDVTITVVKIRRDSVRIGIDAPPSTVILRSEIRDDGRDRTERPAADAD